MLESSLIPCARSRRDSGEKSSDFETRMAASEQRKNSCGEVLWKWYSWIAEAAMIRNKIADAASKLAKKALFLMIGTPPNWRVSLILTRGALCRKHLCLLPLIPNERALRRHQTGICLRNFSPKWQEHSADRTSAGNFHPIRLFSSRNLASRKMSARSICRECARKNRWQATLMTPDLTAMLQMHLRMTGAWKTTQMRKLQ